MSFFLRATALAAALLLVACATDERAVLPAGEKVKVSAQVMEYYKQEYLPKVSSVNAAAFAVSESGDMAGFAYCPDTRCKSGGTAGTHAINNCASAGDKCFVFAEGSHIKVDYEVVP